MSEDVKKNNRRQRVITGTLLAVLVAVVIAIGGWVAALAVGACLAIALREEFQALAFRGHHPVQWPSFAALFGSVPLMLYYSTTACGALLMFFSLVILLCVMTRKEPDLQDVLVSIMPLFSIALPGMCIFGILDTQPRSLQLYLLLLLFLIPILGDTFAYFVGSAVGGPKLCPKISPNKTIAGAVGGLFGSVLAAVLVQVVFTLAVPAQAFPPFWALLLVGLIGGGAAQVGDLLASLVKRYCGIKDFGSIFPGHGGMMDRMDSIVFAAIIIYCFRTLIGG